MSKHFESTNKVEYIYNQLSIYGEEKGIKLYNGVVYEL